MNFLAHLKLSGSSDEVMVGNFITDFIKGFDASSYPRQIYRGILLHREIDSFTDRHQLFAASKKRLWQRHRHYASVIVDLFYDHFLAKNWQQYSEVTLEEFSRQSYATIELFTAILPSRAQYVLTRMAASNWLVQYRDLQGIEQAVQGVARRAAYSTEMALATEDLKKDYALYESDFKLFFPQLLEHSGEFLDILTNGEKNE